jgi:hypothetical protein
MISKSYVRFRATFSASKLRPRPDPTRTRGRQGRFVSGLDEAEKRPKRNAHFATRNKTFHEPGRKSLESLWAPNQSFRGFVCFQWLNPVFVSPFSSPPPSRPRLHSVGCPALSQYHNHSRNFKRRQEYFAISDLSRCPAATRSTALKDEKDERLLTVATRATGKSPALGLQWAGSSPAMTKSRRRSNRRRL